MRWESTFSLGMIGLADPKRQFLYWWYLPGMYEERPESKDTRPQGFFFFFLFKLWHHCNLGPGAGCNKHIKMRTVSISWNLRQWEVIMVDESLCTPSTSFNEYVKRCDWFSCPWKNHSQWNSLLTCSDICTRCNEGQSNGNIYLHLFVIKK